jgi:pimeloyl-ACP methyl ester carboxylesterase
LVVWGSEDPLFPVAHGGRTVSHVADGRLEVIEGSGHWPYKRFPNEFNGMLLGFMPGW